MVRWKRVGSLPCQNAGNDGRYRGYLGIQEEAWKVKKRSFRVSKRVSSSNGSGGGGGGGDACWIEGEIKGSQSERTDGRVGAETQGRKKQRMKSSVSIVAWHDGEKEGRSLGESGSKGRSVKHHSKWRWSGGPAGAFTCLASLNAVPEKQASSKHGRPSERAGNPGKGRCVKNGQPARPRLRAACPSMPTPPCIPSSPSIQQQHATAAATAAAGQSQASKAAKVGAFINLSRLAKSRRGGAVQGKRPSRCADSGLAGTLLGSPSNSLTGSRASPFSSLLCQRAGGPLDLVDSDGGGAPSWRHSQRQMVQHGITGRRPFCA